MQAGTQLTAAQSGSLEVEQNHVLAMLGTRCESCMALAQVRPNSSLIRKQKGWTFLRKIVYLTGKKLLMFSTAKYILNSKKNLQTS